MGSVERVPCRRHAPCLSKQGGTYLRWALAVGAIGWLLCLAQPAAAVSPKETLEAFFVRTNSVLQSMDLTHGLEKPRQAIRDLVDDTFDFRAAAAVALGSVWSSRVPEEQEAFTRLFAVFLERGFVATIGSKASVAGGVRIHYLDESIDGESARVATTLLTRAGQELPVDYWMVRQGARWKVQDVIVDGVSLVRNYRSQFARVLAAHPYAELLRRMQAETLAEAGPAVSPPLKPESSPVPVIESSQLPPAIVSDVLADRAVKPTAAVKSSQPEQPIQKRGSGGVKRQASASAETARPAPPAILVGAPGDRLNSGDVIGWLVVKSRSEAERDVASLLAQAGGTTLSRQRGPKTTMVSGIVPLATYASFAAGLRRMGSWRPETERSPRPNLLYVTVRLTE
jgi:phospholipid transport system substrate-binding protein